MTAINVPRDELAQRMERFVSNFDAYDENWKICAVMGHVNMFYFTGTISDGVLIVRKGKPATLWVRRSYERAKIESEFGDVRPMTSFRDIAESIGALPDTLYLDTASATMEWYARWNRHLPFKQVLPIDRILLQTRAVKTEYELERMRYAGSTVDSILRNEFPSLLRDGISECELGMDLLALYMKHGYQGIDRFSMRCGEMLLGHIAFGDSSLYPSVFDGASGIAGLCPAVPVLGRRDRLLKEGDLIFIDTAFGYDGYHVDKTMIFSYKKEQPDSVVSAHRHCLGLERQAVAMMHTGVSPSDIYKEVNGSVDPLLREAFMGAPGRTVKFIGHGIGLYTDELPVIAKGFDEPLEHGMTIALEPKIGINGVGMVGSENTYLVTDEGAECLTGGAADIIVC